MGSHPTLLGVDVMWIATLLSAVATFAVLVAIYAVTTVRDPMARRVKALNERREQLKAGIVASTNKRKKLDRMPRTRSAAAFLLVSFLRLLVEATMPAFNCSRRSLSAFTRRDMGSRTVVAA